MIVLKKIQIFTIMVIAVSLFACDTPGGSSTSESFWLHYDGDGSRTITVESGPTGWIRFDISEDIRAFYFSSAAAIGDVSVAEADVVIAKLLPLFNFYAIRTGSPFTILNMYVEDYSIETEDSGGVLTNVWLRVKTRREDDVYYEVGGPDWTSYSFVSKFEIIEI